MYCKVFYTLQVGNSFRTLKAHHWLALVTIGCLQYPFISFGLIIDKDWHKKSSSFANELPEILNALIFNIVLIGNLFVPKDEFKIFFLS